MPHEATMSADMKTCIDECTNCHHVCLQTVQHCLEMGGEHAQASHIRLLADCAEICATSMDFMLRGSELSSSTCAACAEVCERCAQECERFDDDFMRQCAEGCRRCAESCRQMARMARAA